MLGHLLYYELAYSSIVQVLNVAVTIVTLSFQGKKQGFFWETETTAIGKQPTNLSLAVSISARTYKRGNFFNAIFHNFLF
jgi:hypothetical protein